MMFRRPTPDELRRTFNTILTKIVVKTIESCPSDTGLDMQTVDVLNAVAAGNAEPEDAMAEFARMIDGTHAREAQTRLEQGGRGAVENH